jgi:hypothetical protein
MRELELSLFSTFLHLLLFYFRKYSRSHSYDDIYTFSLTITHLLLTVYCHYIGKRLISLLQPITTIMEPFSNRLEGSRFVCNFPS